MELSKCAGCMEAFRGYPCPDCGYDPQKSGQAEYALPVETILAGKYLVGRVLGQGGFGITYIGWDLALERKVAIKEYYPSGQVSRQPGTRQLTWYTGENARAAQQSGMEMFLKEARKMVRVDAISGVVRVLDLFRENETAYIVMDFVEGETLKNRLKKTGPMDWAQAKDIFLPAIRAMEEVHKAGLIHRDLSPDNLMLTPEGKVTILDLGAAKDLNINTGASSMQVAKSGFSPFEQYTQRGGSGPWTDVYSMAATIYYTLTGKLPPAAIDRVEEDTIDWSLPRLDTLTGTALEALKKALAVSAKQRTQSMEELEKGLFESKNGTKSIPVRKSETVSQAKLESKTKANVTPKKNTKKLLVVAAAVAVVLGGVFWGMEKPGRDVKKDRILMDEGQQKQVQTTVEATDSYQDSEERAQEAREKQQIVSIAAGGNHTVGLRRDGTVVAVGRNGNGQCDVSDWRDIVAVAAGDNHTVGLRRDGTVVAVGYNECGQCDVSDWSNIRTPYWDSGADSGETDAPRSETSSSKRLQPGQTVTMGHYPKASDSITWQVLDVQGDKALLIARKGLDVQPYNTKYGSVTWETSSLRDWLNTTFLNGSFTAEEQKAIRTTDVDNGKAQGCDLWETDGGNNTQDKIFLLSFREAKKYFDIATPGIDGPEKARIQPTEYAADQGAYVSEEFKTADGKDATRWWLRSPGCNQLDAACVHARGCVGEQMCSNKDTCVRPAMWVDCNKINSR